MTEKEIQERMMAGRALLHPYFDIEDYQTDQELGKPQPPLVKDPVREELISLPVNFDELDISHDFLAIINSRASKRIYREGDFSLLELSYLLWCTQGVKGIRGKKYATLRTVPCGGARHQFETYMTIQHVEGLAPGYYHYLPMKHALELIHEDDGNMKPFITDSLCGQKWAEKASVVFYYSVVCSRVEWRYGLYSHRGSLIDAGHITENLYLALTSIGRGGCAIGAVEEAPCDSVFELDGEDEFIFYAMPAGTIDPDDQDKEDDIYAFVKEQGL